MDAEVLALVGDHVETSAASVGEVIAAGREHDVEAFTSREAVVATAREHHVEAPSAHADPVVAAATEDRVVVSGVSDDGGAPAQASRLPTPRACRRSDQQRAEEAPTIARAKRPLVPSGVSDRSPSLRVLRSICFTHPTSLAPWSLEMLYPGVELCKGVVGLFRQDSLAATV